MENNNRYWIYKNLQKVYITEEYKERNEDKAYDYEMEAILAGLHTEAFNEDDYYELRYERMQDYF